MPYTDYSRNKILDFLHREQAYDPAAARYLALFTVAPTASSGGTELATGDYVRISYAPSLANWSGTQGAGTTSASSGTSGEISNNAEVEFSDGVDEAWNGIVAWGEFDASSGGNLLMWGPIVDGAGDPVTRSFSVGDAVVFEAGTLVCRFAS
jgi:hypothetical protein